jgi:hypothetical protein
MKTFTVTYTVVVTTEDEDSSLNYVTDAISQQLWAIDQDFDLTPVSANLEYAEEVRAPATRIECVGRYHDEIEDEDGTVRCENCEWTQS